MSVEPKVGKTYLYPVEVVALGVTASDVRQWAHAQGLTTSTHGRIGLDLVEAWAAAHPTTTERSSHP